MKYVVRVSGGYYHNIGLYPKEFVKNKEEAMQFDSIDKARQWADDMNNSVRFGDNALFVIEPLEG